jgi:hypothetical protein
MIKHAKSSSSSKHQRARSESTLNRNAALCSSNNASADRNAAADRIAGESLMSPTPDSTCDSLSAVASLKYELNKDTFLGVVKLWCCCTGRAMVMVISSPLLLSEWWWLMGGTGKSERLDMRDAVEVVM